jgi:hypothetical protein
MVVTISKQETIPMTEESTNLPEQDMNMVVSRVVSEQDNERLRSMCSLLNTFNYAVQIQSKREQWEPKDFRLFAIALCAMDQIGLEHGKSGTKVALRAVEQAMQKDMVAMQK